MSRCAIVIHSISGNLYIMANYLKEKMIELGVDARLYRVKDEDLHIWANKYDTANLYYEDILNLSIATKEFIDKADLVVLGSPTFFSNVSAEMKEFMDSTYEDYKEQQYSGKLFGCMTSCTNSISEGTHCLNSMMWWAQMHDMVHLPFINNKRQPVEGIIYDDKNNIEDCIRPGEEMGIIIEEYANCLCEYLLVE